MASPVSARAPVPPAWDASMLPDLTAKIAVVVDAGNSKSNGIGFHIALQLARRGAHVVLALYYQGQQGIEEQETIDAALHEAPVKGGRVVVTHMDVGSLASVAAFAESFKLAHDRLDIYINTSISIEPDFAVTDEGIERQFATNYLGHFALVAGLMELLRKCPDQARIVSTSSSLHKRATFNSSDLVVKDASNFSPIKVYGETSLYKLIFAQELQRRLDQAGSKNVISVAAHPGAMSNGMKEQDFSELGLSFQLSMKHKQSPEMGALVILYATAAPGVLGGDYIGPDGPLGISGYPGFQVPSAFALSQEYGQKLWAASEAMAKISVDF